jgi:hypothetical protein
MLEALSPYLGSWYTLLVILVVCCLYVPLQRLRINRDITFLGGRAPAVQGGFFGWCACTLRNIRSNHQAGLSFIWGAVRSFQDYTGLDFWHWIFGHNGASAKGCYTAEGHLAT